MGILKDWFNKLMKENEENISIGLKNLLIENELEGEQNMPTKEELTQTPENTGEGISVERGVVVFHDESGSLRYQQIGKVSLEDLTFYRRYLDLLEESFWKTEMAGGQNASV